VSSCCYLKKYPESPEKKVPLSSAALEDLFDIFVALRLAFFFFSEELLLKLIVNLFG